MCLMRRADACDSSIATIVSHSERLPSLANSNFRPIQPRHEYNQATLVPVELFLKNGEKIPWNSRKKTTTFHAHWPANERELPVISARLKRRLENAKYFQFFDITACFCCSGRSSSRQCASNQAACRENRQPQRTSSVFSEFSILSIIGYRCCRRTFASTWSPG
jgi:hypothetical protein